ncbi:hypothetical protein Y032_0056g2696 [Ancylostoma ceylanicum]|uniref:Endonuclease/exonuclease/phosphatase domain-containing protein n=1 Tax=Ancylostoma ceylanicum TaxID=53326 RepID=A0A016U6W0_9BILA|nr:hypothetical protein Y032_0056g2696 [Ancylostoma ceylanicum]
MVRKDTGDELIIGSGSGTHHAHGVGFIIRNIAEKLIEVIIHSSRIATLKLNVGRKKPLLTVQVYAPHIGCGIEEIESFYSEFAHHLKQPAFQKLVIGDFNAQIGTRPVNTRYVGKFTGKSWSDAGEILRDFAEHLRLYVAKSFFRKNEEKRWTYELPNVRKTRHEIDHVLCPNMRMVENVEVLSRLSIGSDHRPLRLTVKADVKVNRRRIITRRTFDTKSFEYKSEKKNRNAELCKLIRRKMKQDQSIFRTQRLLQAAEKQKAYDNAERK